MDSLPNILPPPELTTDDKANVFQHFHRKLAAYRKSTRVYSLYDGTQRALAIEIDRWANSLLKHAWVTCGQQPEDDCPILTSKSETSTKGFPPLPLPDQLAKVLSAILFLDITESKTCSARTRAFLSSLGPLNEDSIVSTLKNPEEFLRQAHEQAENVRKAEIERRDFLRMAGIGFGAVAGGILIGVTGGLAAPIVKAGLVAFLGCLGVGGTAAGVIAGGIAGSSVVVGALYGVVGAKRTAKIVGRHTREISDFAILPVRPARDTLAIRLCVSGWLRDEKDIVGPWKIFDSSEDTYALQWEVRALKELSSALVSLLKEQATKFVKDAIIDQTIFAALTVSKAPLVWLKMGRIIDNPWMNARALAVKTGRALGILIAARFLGTRPISLTGYSLGSLVIFEALKYLSTLPPNETFHLIEDVFLFGLPASSTDDKSWQAIRRLVSGKLVNGYVSPKQDYVLAVLSRASSAASRGRVAGLEHVAVHGVENLRCNVEGHLEWVGKVGETLEQAGSNGIVHNEVVQQLHDVAEPIRSDIGHYQDIAKENLVKGEKSLSLALEKKKEDAHLKSLPVEDRLKRLFT